MFNKIGISKKSTMLAYVILVSTFVFSVAMICVTTVTLTVAPDVAAPFVEFVKSALMWFATIATGGTAAYQFAQSNSERSTNYIHPEQRGQLTFSEPIRQDRQSVTFPRGA